MLAEATRNRQPVAITYTGRGGRASERTLSPYGIVAHSGRWYLTGADSASADVRTLRLDRITMPTPRTGSFAVPDDFDAVVQVVTGIAGTPWAHRVSVRVRGTVEQVRRRVLAGIAAVRALPSDPADGSAWASVKLSAERLDWVRSLLAALDLPFVIEEPDALRDLVRDLARRLDGYASATDER